MNSSSCLTARCLEFALLIVDQKVVQSDISCSEISMSLARRHPFAFTAGNDVTFMFYASGNEYAPIYYLVSYLNYYVNGFTVC